MLKLAFLLLASVTLVVRADPTTRLTADYQTEIKSGKTKAKDAWRFVRNRNYVRHERPERTLRWTRMSDHEIGLEQIFHREKVILESTRSEMKARGEEASWSSIPHVVDTNLLSKLTLKGNKKLIGRVGTFYTGKIDGADWQVIWFADLSLAAKVTRRDKKVLMTTEIKKLFVSESSEQDFREYRRVDYADLGDLESDPMIQNLIKSVGGTHRHSHAHN